MEYGLRESCATNFCWLWQFRWVGLDDFWFYICWFWSMVAWWESWHLGQGGLHTYGIYLNSKKIHYMVSGCLRLSILSMGTFWVRYVNCMDISISSSPHAVLKDGVCICRTTTLLSGRILCTISLNLVHWSAGVWAATTHLLLVDMPRASFRW